MNIGGIGFAYPTYVYNPNVVSAKSMDKLSRISDDVLDKKTDYSETVAQENENPLKKGQTIDFESMLDKQMRQGQNRAMRMMTGGMTPAAERETAKAETKSVPFPEKEQVEETKEKVGNPAEKEAADTAAYHNSPTMQMQRAIQAYEMFMTA